MYIGFEFLTLTCVGTSGYCKHIVCLSVNLLTSFIKTSYQQASNYTSRYSNIRLFIRSFSYKVMAIHITQLTFPNIEKTCVPIHGNNVPSLV